MSTCLKYLFTPYIVYNYVPSLHTKLVYTPALVSLLTDFHQTNCSWTKQVSKDGLKSISEGHSCQIFILLFLLTVNTQNWRGGGGVGGGVIHCQKCSCHLGKYSTRLSSSRRTTAAICDPLKEVNNCVFFHQCRPLLHEGGGGLLETQILSICPPPPTIN